MLQEKMKAARDCNQKEIMFQITSNLINVEGVCATHIILKCVNSKLNLFFLQVLIVLSMSELKTIYSTNPIFLLLTFYPRFVPKPAFQNKQF